MSEADDQRRGGLPEDPELAAVFGTTRRRRDRAQQPAAPESPIPAVQDTSGHVEEAPAQIPAPTPAEPPARPAEPAALVPAIRLVVPDVGREGRLTMQCAVNVSVDVQERFDAYQADRAAETGHAPTNAVVVRRAVLAARKENAFREIREAALSRRRADSGEDDDPDGFFGEVEGRRPTRGRMKTSVQQPFRPSRQELAAIDAMWGAYGFPSRSDFLDAVLDWWLPRKPRRGRNG